MRWNLQGVLTLAVVIGAVGTPLARAQKADTRVKPAQAGADPAAARIAPLDQNRLARLLKVWEQQSAQLKSLDVSIQRTDHNPAWGEDEIYLGRALLMSPDLAWLDFHKVKTDKDGKPLLDKDGKPVTSPWERIISTGEEVWQYRSDTKQIFIYPLEKQPQKRALEEGPLPFLFNFREAEARQRYEMSLMEENDRHYWIGITPRLVMDREAFKQAFVKLDKEMLLPVRIYLIAPDGKSTKDFTLKRELIKPNEKVMTENFRGRVYAGWKVVDNREGKGAPPAAAAPAPAPARQAPQPALRQGLLGGRRN